MHAVCEINQLMNAVTIVLCRIHVTFGERLTCPCACREKVTFIIRS